MRQWEELRLVFPRSDAELPDLCAAGGWSSRGHRPGERRPGKRRRVRVHAAAVAA